MHFPFVIFWPLKTSARSLYPFGNSAPRFLGLTNGFMLATWAKGLKNATLETESVCLELCLACPPESSYNGSMKSLTVRLPDSLVAELERESRVRQVSKSDIVRERLRQPLNGAATGGTMADLIGDLIGSVDGLPSDRAQNKKKYLPDLIRARKKLHR